MKLSSKSIALCAFLLLITFSYSSCMFVIPTSTKRWIENKVEDVPIGASKEQIIQEFGYPSARVSFPQQGHLVEIWQYDLGSYWYHEALTLFFRDERFIGVPRTPMDQLKFMQQLHLIEDAAVFTSSN